jgi:hypothetical protein
MRHPRLSEAGAWAERLKQWDPQNGLLPLLAAELIVRHDFPHGVWSAASPEKQQAWGAAMAEAFQAPKFDDYLDRFAALNRKVVLRYRFYDPYEVESSLSDVLPGFTLESCERFAWSLIRSGQELEARDDWRGAREKYWAVARFGQVIDAQGHTAYEHENGAYLQSLAYKPLKTLAERQGDRTEAALFGYLAEKFNPLRAPNQARPTESAFGHFTSERNAAVVEISGLMILILGGFVVISAVILIAGSRPSARPAAVRAKPVATIVAFTSAVGLLFSSVTLYLTYRPYWYIFQGVVSNADRTQSGDLYDFLGSTQMPPGFSPHGFQMLMNALFYSGSPSFLFYVWTGLTLLGVFGLALIILRHFLGRPRAHPP